MISNTSTAAAEKPPRDLRELGAFIADRLREHFPRETERDRQALALAEEAGEAVGAYRRAAGMARRTGTWQEVADELADVAITAHVTAVVLDLDLDVALPGLMDGGHVFPPITGDHDADRHRAVLNVASAAGWFVDAYLLDPNERPALESAMRIVDHATRHAADLLGINLADAVHAKATQILNRGWRDTPADRDTTRMEGTR